MAESRNPNSGDDGASTASPSHVREAASPGAPGVHISAEVDDWCAATGAFDDESSVQFFQHDPTTHDDNPLPEDDEPTIKFNRTYCPLDTDGDGNCPIHVNCSTGEYRIPGAKRT